MATEGAEVMVATHNQGSIEHTVRLMAEMGIQPPDASGVFFGQLLGMADQLSFTLGRGGYRVRPPPHSPWPPPRECLHGPGAVFVLQPWMVASLRWAAWKTLRGFIDVNPRSLISS